MTEGTSNNRREPGSLARLAASRVDWTCCSRRGSKDRTGKFQNTRYSELACRSLTLTLAKHAQTSRGTVTGTVLDSTGSVVAGAHLSLIGVDYGRQALHRKQ
jgi:hypothetical protein